MHAEEFLRVIGDACRLGLFGLVLTGGEPSLRPDIRTIVREARARGLFVSMTTNALELEGDALSAARLCDHVTVSCEGCCREEYLRRRGVDGFDAALAAIRKLTDEGRGPRGMHSAGSQRRPVVHVQVVIDGTNWRDLERLHRFYRSVGVDAVFQLRYGQTFAIDSVEWARMIRNLKYRSRLLGHVMRRFLGQWPGIAARLTHAPCLALSTNFVISPSGHMRACNYRRESLADLRSQTLQEVWPRLGEFRRWIAGPERDCRCANTCFTIPAMLLS
jgi:MoaA/NifB/PqqE/SkfB family radical SAM enzyme